MSIPNGPGRLSRVLLLGGTSEIGLAILSALDLGPDTTVILAGRDPQRLEAAGKSLGRPVEGAVYDALETDPPQAFRGRRRRREGAARFSVRRLGAGPAGRPGHGDEADPAAGLAKDEELARLTI